MKKILIPILVIVLALWGYQALIAGGPVRFNYVSETIGGYIATLTSNAQDQIDGKAATTVVTDTLGAAYGTNAALKLLMPITQIITIGSEEWTPTAGYRRIDTRATCSGTPSAITVGEVGAITDAVVHFLNVGSNDCSIAYAINNFEHNGGAGNSIVVGAGESFEMKFESTAPKWVVTNNNTGTQWISGVASKTPVTDDADDFENAGIFWDSTNVYGGTFLVDGAGTILLATPVAGMNFTVIAATPVAIIIDPQAWDYMMTDGVAGAVGENITSLSAAGDIAYVQYLGAGAWLVTTNGWTPE